MKSHETPAPLSEINVTPFVDVMLVLLVIFMATAPLFEQGIQVDLPKAVTGTRVADVGAVITLTKRHTMFLNQEPVTLSQLRQRLPQYRDDPVVIQADRQASVGPLVNIWDTCREQGVSRIRFVTVDK